MSDIFSKIVGGRNALEQLGSKIPGYKGYQEKEARREADRLLRDEVVRIYALQLARLNDVPSALLEAGKLEQLADVDKARTRLQTFTDRVRTASMGYGGFFDAVKVGEDELQKLYNFDDGLLEGIGRVTAAIDAVVGPEHDAQALKQLIAVADELNNTFSLRESVIRGMS